MTARRLDHISLAIRAFRVVSASSLPGLYGRGSALTRTRDGRGDEPPMSAQAMSDFWSFTSRRESGVKSACATSKSAVVRIICRGARVCACHLSRRADIPYQRAACMCEWQPGAQRAQRDPVGQLRRSPPSGSPVLQNLEVHSHQAPCPRLVRAVGAQSERGSTRRRSEHRGSRNRRNDRRLCGHPCSGALLERYP